MPRLGPQQQTRRRSFKRREDAFSSKDATTVLHLQPRKAKSSARDFAPLRKRRRLFLSFGGTTSCLMRCRLIRVKISGRCCGDSFIYLFFSPKGQRDGDFVLFFLTRNIGAEPNLRTTGRPSERPPQRQMKQFGKTGVRVKNAPFGRGASLSAPEKTNKLN